jgi:hypothetical protein
MSATDKDAPVASGSGRRPAGDEDGGFLSRWSQRKRAVQQEREREDARLAPEAEAEKAAEEARVREENQSAAEAVDMETLSFESDYSVFLKEGVSKHLKNAALQKLWRSNPVLACVDGLNDYDQDFRTVETLTEGLKTSWQVGNGYGWMDEQKKSESAAQAVADAEVPPLDPAAGETPAVAGTLKGEDGEPGAGPDTRSGSDDQTDTGDGSSPSAQGDAAPGDAAGAIRAASITEPVPALPDGLSREGYGERGAASSPEPPARPARKRMRFS